MGKYEPLAEYLRQQRLSEVPMTFAEVERVLGVPLPRSAHSHRPWWANESSGSHIQAKAWLEPGFRTERVDMAGKRLVFVRSDKEPPAPKPSRAPFGFGRVTPMPNVARHPLLGSMKGMIKPAPGVDFTEPADPDWGKRVYEDS